MTNISIQDRAKYIGASEVADLFGVGFKSRWQLWLEKAGRIEPEDLSSNEHVQAGKFLEPAIAEWAAEKWGMKLRKVKRYIQHETVKGMGCSLDFESQEGALIPVEIKWSQSRDGWQIENGELIDVPFKYLLQVQSQLACTGAPYAWIIVLLSGKLYRMRIDMHQGTAARIEKEVEVFWQSIAENKEPKPDFAMDGAIIASMMQVRKDEVKDMTGDNYLPVLCAEYLSAADIAKDATARKETLLAEIRSLTGDAGKVLADGFIISNSPVAASQINYMRKAYINTRIVAKEEKPNE